MTDAHKHVESLIKKSAECPISHEAMQYAQAALNAANAILTMDGIRKNSKPAAE